MYRCREGRFPAGYQLPGHAQVPADPQGQGRVRVRHQGPKQGPGKTVKCLNLT